LAAAPVQERRWGREEALALPWVVLAAAQVVLRWLAAQSVAPARQWAVVPPWAQAGASRATRLAPWARRWELLAPLLRLVLGWVLLVTKAVLLVQQWEVPARSWRSARWASRMGSGWASSPGLWMWGRQARHQAVSPPVSQRVGVAPATRQG